MKAPQPTFSPLFHIFANVRDCSLFQERITSSTASSLRSSSLALQSVCFRCTFGVPYLHSAHLEKCSKKRKVVNSCDLFSLFCIFDFFLHLQCLFSSSTYLVYLQCFIRISWNQLNIVCLSWIAVQMCLLCRVPFSLRTKNISIALCMYFLTRSMRGQISKFPFSKFHPQIIWAIYFNWNFFSLDFLQ